MLKTLWFQLLQFKKQLCLSGTIKYSKINICGYLTVVHWTCLSAVKLTLKKKKKKVLCNEFKQLVFSGMCM